MKKAAATAAKPPARRSARTARNATTTKETTRGDSGRSADALPTIFNVHILWSDDDGVPAQSYPSLWAADVALAQVFHRTPPPSGGTIKIGFRVEWTDGDSHEGRLDVSSETMRDERGAGLLRTHLVEHARWISGEFFLRMFAGRRPGDELEQQRQWGVELLRRVERDTRSHVDPDARRNGPLTYAGEGVPELGPWKSGADLLSHLRSPPRLFPAPRHACIHLLAELKAAFPDRRVDWTAPPTNAMVNYVSHALRHDLPSIDPLDAAVIWKKWRDLVVAFRNRRTATDSVAFEDRLERVVDDLIAAVANPGEVWSSFCPLRGKYVDPERQNMLVEKWELDSWLP